MIASVPVLTPAATGLNAIFNRQLAPRARINSHVMLLTKKSPLVVTDEIAKAAVPSFVVVTALAKLMVLTFCGPKLSLTGLARTDVLMPLSFVTVGLPPPL